MEYTPIFFKVENNQYRLHFPYLLKGFEKSMLEKNDAKTYDASERLYEIKGFSFGNVTYDISVREFGSDLAPTAIETWFYVGGVTTDAPAELRSMIAARNSEATRNRTQVYVNNARV
jgi:hypothetical protein